MKSTPPFIDGYTHAISEIIGLLQRGCVIAGDSDTVPGLLAPLTEQGFKSLNSIKGRFEKPYLILVDSPEKLSKFVEFPLNSQIIQLVEHCWPGPLTIIFKAKKELPAYLKSADGTVAIRIPKHTGLLKVLAPFDGLFSTSANKAGQPVPHDCAGIDPAIVEQVSLVVHEPNELNVPSTIIDCAKVPCAIVREGAYSKIELEKILEN